jgi:hypothetical protein
MPGAQPNALPGSGGQVMYFQKPAEALTATGGPGSSAGTPVGEVVQANAPSGAPVKSVPDALPAPLPPPPPPPPPQSRYTLPPPAVNIPSANLPPATADPYTNAPVNYQPPEPGYPPTTSKKQGPIPAVPDRYIRIPSRENIFTVYDDSQLEAAIMKRLIQDRIDDQDRKIREAEAIIKNPNTKPPEIEKANIDLAAAKSQLKDAERDMRALVETGQAPTYQFPPSPVVSPPGVAYESKTSTYPPRQAILEPGYVVHRPLYFEERNAERTGWDLGPFQILVSTTYFWRDALLIPQSAMTNLCRGSWDTSAGKCLPGGTSPYYIYPVGLTVSGTAFETLTAIGISFALFP